MPAPPPGRFQPGPVLSLTRETIDGPAGALEVASALPDGQPVALAVVCHPHPLHGGTLDNKIVHQLARTFGEMGAVSVRFNFRGVGNSEGDYDRGRGELQDLLAVVDWAQGRWPALPLWLAGFSFGGYIAIQAAQGLRPQRLVTVSPAVNYFHGQCPALAGIDWLLIQGDADDVVPLADVQAWLQTCANPPVTVVLAGAGHFFHGRLNALKDSVRGHFGY